MTQATETQQSSILSDMMDSSLALEVNNGNNEAMMRRRQKDNQERRDAAMKEQAKRYIYNYVNHQPDQVALYSAVLSICFTLGICAAVWLFWYGSYFQLPLYVSSLMAFHFLEYWITARYNPNKVSVDCTFASHLILVNSLAFLIRNGRSYTLAHLSALIEALIEWYFFGSLKTHRTVSAVGFLLIAVGQTLRSMAMIHASSNFSHMIASRKTDSHVLVTTGVYGYTRHPSYLGYFCWAIGTQLFLMNPVASVVFTVVLWRFFRNRIRYEEKYLIDFFGSQYIDYKQATGTLIPFIT